jgi:hypothetical protein
LKIENLETGIFGAQFQRIGVLRVQISDFQFSIFNAGIPRVVTARQKRLVRCREWKTEN